MSRTISFGPRPSASHRALDSPRSPARPKVPANSGVPASPRAVASPLVPVDHRHPGSIESQGPSSLADDPSTSLSSTSAAQQPTPKSRASLSHSPTATSLRAADSATECHLPHQLQEQLSHPMQRGLQHSLQPDLHQFLHVPAPSLPALSAVESICTNSALPLVSCQGLDSSTASALPSDEQNGAEPSSAEDYKDGDASKAQQSSAAAFLDNILAQSRNGRLFKGRAHMHRLAKATSSNAQPADDLADNHVGLHSSLVIAPCMH